MRASTRVGLLLALSWCVLGVSCSQAPITLEAGSLICRLDERGHLMSLMPRDSDREYLAPGEAAPLLSVRTEGRWISPTALDPSSPASMGLVFGDTGIRVDVLAIPHETHLSLDVLAVHADTLVDALRWGPFPVAIGDTVGEIVGVVRNRDFAIGLQALNAKTVGGVLENEGLWPGNSI